MKKSRQMDEEFKKIGKPKNVEPEIHEKTVYYDKRQYSLKIPKAVMDKIGHEDGDKIVFILKKPFRSLNDLEIKYKRDNAKKK